jgi:hypothetical protein
MDHPAFPAQGMMLYKEYHKCSGIGRYNFSTGLFVQMYPFSDIDPVHDMVFHFNLDPVIPLIGI